MHNNISGKDLSQYLSNSDCRFSTSLLYYGLSLNVGTFGLNVYLTQLMFGLVEFPANLGVFFLIQHFGRRICLASFLFFGGAACLLILAVPKGTLELWTCFLS